MNSRGAPREISSNEQGEDLKKKKVFSSKISTNSSYRLKILAIFHEFFSEDQKKKGLRSKNFMKFGVSPQKLRKYGWQTLIWASICTLVAPSLLISSGHNPRLGRLNFCLGGHKQSFGGGTAPECPRGAGPEELRLVNTNLYGLWRLLDRKLNPSLPF